MLASATCTVAVYRDTTVDDTYADFVDQTDPDLMEPSATGVPCAVREQTRRVWDQSTGTPRVVRTVYGRVAAGVDVRANDRLVDEQTGVVYFVDAVQTRHGQHYATDALLELRTTT